jgi:hypothetical protein
MYWQGNFDKAFNIIRNIRGLRLDSERGFKGLDVFVFTNEVRAAAIRQLQR